MDLTSRRYQRSLEDLRRVREAQRVARRNRAGGLLTALQGTERRYMRRKSLGGSGG